MHAHGDTMSSTEKVVWNTIAEQDAIHGGDAVYIARARLNKDVIDEPVGYYRLSHQQSDAPAQIEAQGKIIPNPARDEVIYYYKIDGEKKGLIEIKDVTGRILVTKNLDGKQASAPISLAAFAPAVYFYRSVCDGAIVDEGKLVIIK